MPRKKMKLTSEDKRDIYNLFWSEGEKNISKIAREYKVSRALIQFIVYPERLARMKHLAKMRGTTNDV